MKTITTDELHKALSDHKVWLNDNSSGNRLDLNSIDLSYADLRYADLRYADLSYANLSNTSLMGANLRYANLRLAYLIDADLNNANLRDADLHKSNLVGADLRFANLSNTNVRQANLYVLSADHVIGIELQVIGLGNHRVVRHGDRIMIGCQQHDISYWMEHIEEIGRRHRYAEAMIAKYKFIIESMSKGLI